jgi:hypothetical protein
MKQFPTRIDIRIDDSTVEFVANVFHHHDGNDTIERYNIGSKPKKVEKVIDHKRKLEQQLKRYTNSYPSLSEEEFSNEYDKMELKLGNNANSLMTENTKSLAD